MSPPVIAIDGPAASGKSSTAAAVAAALGYAHLDSGALYRGVTILALELGAPPEPEAILRSAEARGLTLHYDGRAFEVYLAGEPLGERLRTAEVTSAVSAVSALPAVREWINARLRGLVRPDRPVVLDGRDIGTAVFPDAPLKVFLTASPEVRARRRLQQRNEDASSARVEAEARILKARDEADSKRPTAPLRKAQDAHLLDTSDLTFEEQVGRIVAWAAHPGLPKIGG